MIRKRLNMATQLSLPVEVQIRPFTILEQIILGRLRLN